MKVAFPSVAYLLVAPFDQVLVNQLLYQVQSFLVLGHPVVAYHRALVAEYQLALGPYPFQLALHAPFRVYQLLPFQELELFLLPL